MEGGICKRRRQGDRGQEMEVAAKRRKRSRGARMRCGGWLVKGGKVTARKAQWSSFASTGQGDRGRRRMAGKTGLTSALGVYIVFT